MLSSGIKQLRMYERCLCQCVCVKEVEHNVWRVVMHNASWMGEVGKYKINDLNRPPCRPSVLGRSHTAAVSHDSAEDMLPI